MYSLLQRAGAAVTGDPEYRPGDITRNTVGAVGRGVVAVSEGVVRAAGAPDYRFGDVSRAVVGGLSEVGVVVGGSTISFFENFLRGNNAQFAVGVEGVRVDARLGPNIEANVVKIWSAFFGQCYEEGAAALRQGELKPEDVLDREVFFFIGLPARTLLGTCLRTLDAPPDDSCGGSTALRLSDGLVVAEGDVHSELKPLFAALQGIKQQLADAQLTQADRSLLRFETLFGGTDRTPPQGGAGAVDQETEREPEPEPQDGIDRPRTARSTAETTSARPELCHTLAGALSALATQVTQLSFFKQNYTQVLDELDTIALDVEKTAAGCT